MLLCLMPLLMLLDAYAICYVDSAYADAAIMMLRRQRADSRHAAARTLSVCH